MEVREVKKEEYPIMDREYFSEENVRRDLNAYCEKAGLNNVSELKINYDLCGIEVVCSNGDTVNFKRYLKMASKVISDEKLTNGQALDTLKKIYGLEIEVREVIRKEYPKMNREYFCEENVRRDLNAYCAKAGLSDVSELITSFQGLEVVCSNGEPLMFSAYLKRASRKLSDKVLKKAQTLDKLKIIYGLYMEVREVKEYPIMNREYFCEENVRRELETYCAKAGLSDVSELKANKDLFELEVVCSNGEPVKFQKYLYRASKALSDGKFTVGQALNVLKKMIS